MSKCIKFYSLLKNVIFNSSKNKLLKKYMIIDLFCTKVKILAISEILKISKQNINKLMQKIY